MQTLLLCNKPTQNSNGAITCKTILIQMGKIAEVRIEKISFNTNNSMLKIKYLYKLLNRHIPFNLMV